MPQLDIDLFDDFLFFAFVSILFGFGDEDVDEAVIEIQGESYLGQYYVETTYNLKHEETLIKALLSKAIT